MAFSNVYRMNVDIKRRLTSVVPTFKQGDNGVLRFKLYDDGRLFDLSSYTSSEITFRLPNGESLVGNPDLVNGELVYNFTRAEMAVVGKVETVLSIMSGNSMVSLQPFMCFIFDSMKSENLSYIGILQELIKEVQDLGLNIESVLNQVGDLLELVDEELDELRNLVSSVEITEATRISNEQSRVANESTRTTDENTRVSNESTRVNAENTRIQNETQRQNRFTTKIDEFEDKIGVLDEVKTLPYYHLTTFKPPNFVTYNGSTYAVLKTVTGVTPSDDGVNYRIAAQRGVDGNGAVSTINGISPNSDGNVEIELISQEFVDHERNETNQLHIETVTSIPTNLANSGIIVKVDGANPTIPETPTLDQFEEDVREILEDFSDEIEGIQTELTQQINLKANVSNLTALSDELAQHLAHDNGNAHALSNIAGLLAVLNSLGRDKISVVVTDGNGTGMCPRPNAIYLLLAQDIGNKDNYLLATGVRNPVSYPDGLPSWAVINSNTLSIGISNNVGTQVINGTHADVVRCYCVCIEGAL